MARVRSVTTELARLLDKADQPVYLLDDEQTLVFCNRACLDWVGLGAGELLGKRCAYTTGSELSGAEAVAAGLCPPPSAWTVLQTTAVVARAALGGRLARRRARFIPLGGVHQQPAALLALVDAEDLPDAEAMAVAAADSEAALLHERLRNFRRQAQARYRVDRLVGEGPAMRCVRAQVELAAGSRASVLVIGPPGSGRQHIAAAIHYSAPNAAIGPLVPLACSVLGADLIHSTVLALAGKAPLEATTGQGTLVLNDADQLPPEVQSPLCGTLAGKTFPLRLIATARQQLDELARQDKFRADLAALLSTMVIELPPLAQRRHDLPTLAQWFLEEVNARAAKQIAGFSPEALDMLDAYHWPGNLDELAAAVAEAHQRAEGPEIGLGDLPQRLHLAAGAAAHPRRTETTIVLDEFLAQIELELIRRALARAKGNKTKAAKLLGMTRPRLYRRLVQLGLIDNP